MKSGQSSSLLHWIARLGLAGILLSLLYFLVKAIAEYEIQGWWRDVLRPFLVGRVPILVRFEPYGWQLIFGALVGLVVLAGILYGFFLMGYQRHSSSTQGVVNQGIPTSVFERRAVTNMDIVNAVAAYRHSQIDAIDLATLVMYAVNGKTISPQVGDTALGFTSFRLKKIDAKHIFAKKDA